MSSTTLSQAWTSDVKGMARLALVALADHADYRGEVTMSQRDLAALCHVSKSRASTLLTELLDTGIMTVLNTGGGRGNSSKYKINLRDQKPKANTGDRVKLDTREEPETNAAFLAGGKKYQNPDTFHPTPPADIPAQLREPTEIGRIAQGVTVTAEEVDRMLAEAVTPEDFGVTPAPVLTVHQALAAAGVPNDPMQPLYWNRREHREELRVQCEARGLDTPVKALAFIAERREQIREPAKIRSIRVLFEVLG